jgi:aryl-alcohol dehydrogenase-like predicted oxidoreductase
MRYRAERRGLERFRTEQSAYSILNRGIEAEVLPVAQRYGMGVVVWSPLAQGLLTGRVRKGQQTDLRRTAMFSHMRDERRLDAVEKIIPLACWPRPRSSAWSSSRSAGCRRTSQGRHRHDTASHSAGPDDAALAPGGVITGHPH